MHSLKSMWLGNKAIQKNLRVYTYKKLHRYKTGNWGVVPHQLIDTYKNCILIHGVFWRIYLAYLFDKYAKSETEWYSLKSMLIEYLRFKTYQI